VIIPPSIPMILFGVSAEVSIGELFIAGVGPGLLIGGSLMIFVYLYAKHQGLGQERRHEGRLGIVAIKQAGWRC
jgi:C4-dicarboxylate transporter DctM subunit